MGQLNEDKGIRSHAHDFHFKTKNCTSFFCTDALRGTKWGRSMKSGNGETNLKSQDNDDLSHERA